MEMTATQSEEVAGAATLGSGDNWKADVKAKW